MPKQKIETKQKANTSIKIDPDLWKEAKIEAIREDMDVSELVERALREDLEKARKLGEVKEQ